MDKPDAVEGAGEFTTEGASIGLKIREWRKEQSLTLAALAQAVGLSTGYVSQVERGLANPSLETLKRLADAVGHTVGELFSGNDTRQNTSYSISKRGQRKKIQYPGSGIMNELLSPDLHHQMEVIWVEAPPGASSGGHPHAHQGEECGIVIKGQMIFWVGPDQVILDEGDSIYLDSTIPHRWTAADKGELQAVWLITPPTF